MIAEAQVTQAMGRWVTAKKFALHADLSEQSLANWRYEDRKAGRTGARDGYPVYKYFGTTVRYWVPENPQAAA